MRKDFLKNLKKQFHLIQPGNFLEYRMELIYLVISNMMINLKRTDRTLEQGI